MYSFERIGVRLENHLSFPVMWREQPEFMIHLFSKPPTFESLSDLGEELACVGVACPPEDARAPSASPAMVQKLLRRPAAKQSPMNPVASLSCFFFFLSSSSEVGEEERSVSELLSRSLSCARKAFPVPLLGLVLEALLERLLVEASSPVTTAVLVALTLLVGASLIAVAVAVVVGVIVLATAGLLGTVGDEVVQIAAVVAPGVLLPLPVMVDTLELVDEETQVVVAQRL